LHEKYKFHGEALPSKMTGTALSRILADAGYRDPPLSREMRIYTPEARRNPCHQETNAADHHR
jgi:hypothetical protein